jgi:hypothetical protein
MASVRLALSALTCVFSAGIAFAQDDAAELQRKREAEEAARRELAQRQEAERIRVERERNDQLMKEFLTDTRDVIAKQYERSEALRQGQLQTQRAALVRAFLDYKDATRNLRDAIVFNRELKAPARGIYKTSGVFLTFVRQANKQRPGFDPKQFKGFTPSQLGRETLTLAERLGPDFLSLIEKEADSTVDLSYLMSLSKLEVELMRLQWLSKNLK